MGIRIRLAPALALAASCVALLLPVGAFAAGDTTPPMGTIDPIGPYLSGTSNITGSAFDSESGVAGVTVTYSGPSSGTICVNPPQLAPWSCSWNTVVAPDGVYTLQLLVTDADGNSSGPITYMVVVDNEAPIAFFDTFIETTNPAFQYAVGSTMYVNPAYAGSFDVRVIANDSGVGVDRVEFPALGAGWTPGGGLNDMTAPYDASYSWSPGAASPGAQAAVALDFVGWVSVVPFSVVADSLAPAGGSITHSTGTQTPGTGSVSYTPGSDAESGVASAQIQRASAPLSAGVCGAFGVWVNVGPISPASPWSDTTTMDGFCYRYRLVVTDRVGNVSTVAGPGDVKAQASGAAAVILSGGGAALSVAEGGATDTISFVLSSAPVASVQLTFGSVSQFTAAPTSLTFTTGNWNVPQNVTVTAIDDPIDEVDPHSGSIAVTVASADPVWNATLAPTITGSVSDDDVADIQVSGGPSLAVAEAGATSDTFTMSLTSMPTSTVVVDLASVDGQTAASPSTLVFTPMNWNIPQVATVTAVDDAVVEASPHLGVVRSTVTSADPTYDALTIADIAVDITDDDVGGPTAEATLGSIVEGSGPEFQHVSGSTLWFNPLGSGSFIVNASATGTGGVAQVTFPGAGAAGWTPTGTTSDAAAPYVQTYSWTSGAAEPGTRGVTATSNTGLITSAPATFALLADSTSPTGIGVTTPASTTTRDTSAPITAVTGIDSQSGIGSWQLQRSTAALGGGACGAYGAWSNLGPVNPAGSVIDTLGGDGCVRWRLQVSDRVGNLATAESVGALRVDRTAPIGTIDAFPGTARGTVELHGTVADAGAGVRNVGVGVDGSYTICGSASVDAAGRWTCTWDVDAVTLATLPIQATFIDVAGNHSTANATVTVGPRPSVLGPTLDENDHTPPLVEIAPIPAITWDEYAKVEVTASDAASAPVRTRIEQRSAAASAAAFGAWVVAYPEEGNQMPLGRRGTTTCWRAVATDAMDNVATSAERCTTVPLDDTDLRAVGRWTPVEALRSWLGASRRAARAGVRLETTVRDATPQVVVTKCRRCGSIRVLHGARVLGTYSLAAPRTRERVVITLPRLTSPASAPLRIVAAGRGPVQIDGLIAGRD